MTRAPAASARAAVSSVDPSSTTSTSRQGRPALRADTTAPMPSSSLKAGMTTETSPGSATVVRQLQLAHAVEQVLEQLAVRRHEVRHEAPLQRDESHEQEQH